MEQLPPPPVPLRPDLAPAETEYPRRRRFPRWVTVVCVLLALSLGALAIAPLFEGTEQAAPGPGFHFLDRTDHDDSDIPFERGDRVAAGVAVPVIPPTRLEDIYVSGWVAMNADDPNPPGFSFPGQQGPVILHELGHLMGLGHVRAVG